MSVNSHPAKRAVGRKRPVQARSQRTVDAILDAAAHMFGERGYTGTTTNHVAEAAGVSIGSLYQYFPNKDALLVALDERHLEDARRALDKAAGDWRGGHPRAGTWAHSFVQALVDVNDSDLHRLLYDTAPMLPHIRGRVDALVETLSNETAVQLRRWGHRRGAELRARILVITALALIHELIIQIPPGRERTRAQREVERFLTAYAEDGGSVKRTV
jgi:AcrR family transcriptional regulator